MNARNILLAIALGASVLAQAQRLWWSVDFNTVFDNREGDRTYTEPRTFFQTQLSPEIGISLLDGTHRLAGGVVYTQPIGSEWDGHKLSPTLYYHYSAPAVQFSLGMFPRTQLHRPLPNYIWSDSSYYCQRNIRGAMAQIVNDKGFFEAVLDWRGMQGEHRREAFNIIVSGERAYRSGALMWGGTAMMNHYAKSKHPVDENLVDNFLVNPYVGVDLSKTAFRGLDSCAVRVGALASFTRDRGDMDWKTPVGAWLDIDVAWRWLEVKNTTYAGGRLFPYYSRYGAMLDQGEPFYASKWYNRTSVFGTILSNDFMNLRASLDFNVAKGCFIFYQRLMLRFYFGADSRSRKSKLPPVY